MLAMQSWPEALVLSGAYGAGKSAVAVEIADILEARGAPFAAIDLDWLTWSNAPGAHHGELELLVGNLGAVVANYRAAGVRLFVLAYAVADEATLEAIRAVLAMPVRVVRLTVPVATIEERLGSAQTRGRADDLVRAREWIAEEIGVGLEDVAVDNAGQLRETAAHILTAIGWA
jgi:chloramphenicol 3-O-phosphotransferase